MPLLRRDRRALGSTDAPAQGEKMRPSASVSHPPSRAGRTRRGAFAAGAALTAAGSIGTLGACAMPGSDAAPAASAKEVTISYVSDWSAIPRVDWIKAAIPRFTEENPKIKVQVDNWAGEVGATAI